MASIEPIDVPGRGEHREPVLPPPASSPSGGAGRPATQRAERSDVGGEGSPSGWIRRSLCLALLLVCSSALLAHARVFTRWSGVDDVARTFESFGGRLLYDSRISINDGPGELSIYGIEEPYTEIIASLRQAFGAETFSSPSPSGGEGTLAQGVIARGNAVVRLIVVQPDSEGPTIAFAVRQTRDDFSRSTAAPAAHALAGIPPYPGSTATFFAADSRAGAEFAVATAQAALADINRFYRTGLEKAGWRPLIPRAASAPDAARLDVFARGDELCLLLVTDAPGSRASTITLLHKRAGMK